MKFGKLERALKTATSSKEDRPVLQSVHFDKDGSITATDSHVLLRLEDQHHLETDFNWNLKYFTEELGMFPDTKRLIPDEYNARLVFSSAVISDFAKMLKALKGQLDTVVHIVVKGEQLTASRDGFTAAMPVLEKSGDEIDFSVNALYLMQALEFFAEYLRPLEKIELGYTAPLRPFVLKARKATYLITPVRTF